MAGRRQPKFARSANGRIGVSGWRLSSPCAPAVISIDIINRFSGRATMATSYSIGKHFEDMIDGLIKDGRYATGSEIIRAGLRLIEEREERRKAKLEALRVEIKKGIDSGPAQEVDISEMMKSIKARGRQRLAA